MKYRLLNESLQDDSNYSLVEKVFLNRGFENKEDIYHYFNCNESDLYSPYKLDNILLGVNILINHIYNNDKIFIQADSDSDGFTSSALLINYLYKLFPTYTKNKVIYRIHSEKHHGLIFNTIPKDVKLVIAPDASSNEREVHERIYKEIGAEVLVLDHHPVDEENYNNPYACIINNQLCDYPNKTLSGVGIVYKFCSLIDSMLGINYADDLLDIVALGLTSDMVDIRNCETRYLIKKGLEELNNPFMRAMAEKNAYSLKGELSPLKIAFYITPYVNAACRSGTFEEKKIIFESMLTFKGDEEVLSTKRGHSKGELETLATQAVRVASNLKNRQDKEKNAWVETLEENDDKSIFNHNLLLFKIDDSDFNKNLSGLIANQLAAKYGKPTLVLSKKYNAATDIITYEGSGRFPSSADGFSLKKFLKDSKYCLYAEGHDSAFGCGLLDTEIEPFIEYCDNNLPDLQDSIETKKVDFIFDSKDLSCNDILEITKAERYFGQNIPEVYIAIENIKIASDNLSIMSKDKNPTLKIHIPSKGYELIKFKLTEEETKELFVDEGYKIINIVGKCSKNEWNGNITPQIIISNYEIIDSQKYYF